MHAIHAQSFVLLQNFLETGAMIFLEVCMLGDGELALCSEFSHPSSILICKHCIGSVSGGGGWAGLGREKIGTN